MIRIRTTLESGQVFTLFWHGQWITICSFKDKSKKTTSVDALDLLGAGENHLRFVQVLRIQELLPTERHKHYPL